MTMLQIKYFITVVSTGSVSKAASLLFVSRPAISRALKDLESELGVPMFVRSASGLELTKIGRLIYGNFKKIQQIVNQTNLQISNFKEVQEDDANGVLKLGLSPVTPAVFFPEFYRALTAACPQITLTTVESDYNRCLAAISDGSLDFLLVADSLAVKLPSGFQALDFCKDELALAVPPSHALVGKRSVTVEDFKDEPLIFPAALSGIEQLISKRFSAHGYTPHVILRTQQLSAIAEFVSKGLGCSVLTKWDIPDRDRGNLVFIPISPSSSVSIRLIWNPALPQRERAHSLLEFSKRYKESMEERIKR